MTSASHELRYDDYRADSHRPAFDGLRGIGFLLVITAHIPTVPLFVYLQGWSAVWIFLVMSGYLIAMLLMREEERSGSVAFGAFLVKRFCRIVPSYWAAIALYWLACFAFEPSPGDYAKFMTRLPWYLAFAPEYGEGTAFSIFTHSWTVGVELKFYLLFPPILFLAIKNANARFAVTAIAAVLLTVQGSFNAQSYCALLCGAMLAFTLERPQGYAFIARMVRVPLIVPLAMIVALFVMLLYTEQLSAVASVATYVMAYAIVQPHKVARVLCWRPLVYLGQRSYGAYLLHVLGVRYGYMLFGDSATGGILIACFCLAVTVPAAELMYRFIEWPAIDYGRRLLSRTRPATAR
ncbi:MAG TPA: acyltransferase [Pseudolabrys sp.]|nr:acyltransferase [Pseudolabrys sp.]